MTDHTIEAPKTIGIVTDIANIDAAVLAAFYAHRNFSLTSTALQRRLDRLHVLKDGRGRALGKEVSRTAKEYDVHETGEPYQSYLAALSQVQPHLKDPASMPMAALNEVLAFAPATHRLYEAHKAAVKAKKAEMDRLGSKLSAVQAALEKHLRNGIGARDAAVSKTGQEPLPGMEAEVEKPMAWADDQTRQAILDTLSMELQIIGSEASRAAAANDVMTGARVEQDRRQHAELLDQLNSTGFFEGLEPDLEDESVAPAPEDDTGEPDVEFDVEDKSEPELEDPRAHPDLQPAIAKTAAKRASRKTGSAAANGPRKPSQRSAGAKRGRKGK